MEPRTDRTRHAPHSAGERPSAGESYAAAGRVDEAPTSWDKTGFRHRAIGAVVGSAVGDALGAPFEFGPAGGYSARFPVPVLGGVGEMVGGGGFGWAPGEFTDDTQMAIAQVESILASGRVDGSDLFERFRIWASQAADVGVQTSSVLHSGRPWDLAASEHFQANPHRGAGNGSLMRSTPTAVHFAKASLDDTIAAAWATSMLTHGDPATGWGTAIHHAMVRAALRGGDPFAALDEMLAGLPEGQYRFREMLDSTWTPGQSGPSNGSVWGCLAQAVWAVRTTATFADAVIAAIELGGDTDTVAAVAGGLAGAIYGVQAIPSRWMTYVHGHVTGPDGTVTYDCAALQDLTTRLIGDRQPPMMALGPGAGPTEIAPGLFAADLGAAAELPTDFAVISLCRTAGRFDRHPVRRSVYIVDKRDANPGLGSVARDIVTTIDAFLAEGRNVVVHCHAGQSRTGFALRAWLMHRHGWDEPTATAHVAQRWQHLRLGNGDFTEFLAGS